MSIHKIASNAIHSISLKQLSLYNTPAFQTEKHISQASLFLLQEIPTRLARTYLEFDRHDRKAKFEAIPALGRLRSTFEKGIEHLLQYK